MLISFIIITYTGMHITIDKHSKKFVSSNLVVVGLKQISIFLTNEKAPRSGCGSGFRRHILCGSEIPTVSVMSRIVNFSCGATRESGPAFPLWFRNGVLIKRKSHPLFWICFRFVRVCVRSEISCRIQAHWGNENCSNFFSAVVQGESSDFILKKCLNLS